VANELLMPMVRSQIGGFGAFRQAWPDCGRGCLALSLGPLTSRWAICWARSPLTEGLALAMDRLWPPLNAD
jgi:hypothetical protein